MMEYDLIIIGSGIAGSSLLYLAKKLNTAPDRIALIDRGLIGGEISRFGGAVNLVFGEGERLSLNISGEKYFHEIYEKGAPIIKIKSNIYTENNNNQFPYAIEKNDHLEQSAYIGNPAEIARWLCKESCKNTDFYTCTNLENINTKEKQIELSTGIVLKYQNLILATGNHLPKIDGAHYKTIDIYKKLCVLNIKSPFLSNDTLHFFADEDAYCFPDSITGQSIFCYPTDTYINKLDCSNSIIVKKQDIDMGLKFIDRIKLLKDSEIYGGRIFFEGYTENRVPKFEPFKLDANIFLLTAFSGSGLRLSFGVAEKILTLLMK